MSETAERDDPKLWEKVKRQVTAGDKGELDGREIVGGIFVISRGDAAELLDPVEEALDEIALAVEPGREG